MKNCNDNINGFNFVLHSTLVSFILANNLEAAEQAILGVFLSDIGSNLLSISAYNKYVEDSCSDKTDENKDINIPITQIYNKTIYKQPFF
jgi:hypothetical protein